MTSRRAFLRLTASLAGLSGAVSPPGRTESAFPASASAETHPIGLPDGSPWGIATSHSRSQDLDWLHPIGEVGMSALRGYHRDKASVSLEAAAAAGFQVSGILQTGEAFPVDDMAAWEAHVASTVAAARGRVRHWEVWNEPPNFSTDERPESYAALVVRAHQVVKRLDPVARVGICAASVHLNFMERALLAGAAGHFDYVTLHPYETLATLDRGFESLFLSIVPTVRKMLRASSPAQAEVPVLFTEIGMPVSDTVTPDRQADAFVKAYVLSLAQGVARVHWFEGRDGDSGPFGLIAEDGTRRPSYFAAARLIARLGQRPRFLGWLDVSGAPRAFAFDGAEGPVVVAWAPPESEARVDFGAGARIVDSRTGTSIDGSDLRLSDVPVLVTGASPEILERARGHLDGPPTWNGDFTAADRIAFEAGKAAGIHPLNPPSLRSIDGEAVLEHGWAASHPFAIDPNFLSWDTVTLRVSAEVRRTGAADAGVNLKYESVRGMVVADGWRSVPEGEGWHTLDWIIEDPRFVGRWGYHILLDSDAIEHGQYALRRLVIEKLP